MKKVERISINCKRCGKVRYIFPILLKKNRGKYCSVSCARKNNPPTWMHKNYEGRGKKIGESLKRGNWQEDKSSAWKGDNVGYRALHYWVEKQLGKANHCQYNKSHISTRYHWANVSRQYKRDISDWVQLCPSCHFRADRRGEVIFH